MRTATHAFNIDKGKTYARYSWNSKEWDGGFGRQVLGETWVNHHGDHGKQSTRGIIAPGAESHPILRGIKDGDIWGADRRLHRPPAAARRQQAAGARPGPRGDEADRQARRRQEERPDDADRLDQDLHQRVRQDRPRLHDHDGGRRGPPERGHAPAAGQRHLLGGRPRGQDPRARATSTSSANSTRTPSASAASPRASSPPTW